MKVKIKLMTKLITFLLLTFLLVQTVDAQKIRTPLPDKVQTEAIPPSPGENYTWVKPHWKFVNTKYVWTPGKYIETKANHIWRDAYWERNQKTGWWVMNPGYWQRQDADLELKGGTEVKPTGASEKKKIFINMSSTSPK